MKLIRLGKAAGELNVGMSTLAEFLQSKGHSVDPNPNTKLTPEQYALLRMEFAADQTLKKLTKQPVAPKEKKETPIEQLKNIMRQNERLTIKIASEQFGVTMNRLVEFLQGENIPISKPYSPEDEITGEQYKLLESAFGEILKFKDDTLKKYFHLDLANEEMFAAGEVETGVHGVETVDGDHYASLYHIVNFTSKGELKSFLANFSGQGNLSELARIISSKYDFDSVYVKYKNQGYEIKKYPYKAILNYFLESKSEDKEQLIAQIQNESTIGLCELEAKLYRRFERLKPIQLGKINFFVGQNNAGKSTVVEMLRLLISYLKQSDHSTIDLNGVNYGRILNTAKTEKEDSEIGLGGKFDDCSFHFKFYGPPNSSKSSTTILRINNPYFSMSVDFRNADIQVTLKLKDDDISLDEMSSLATITDVNQKIHELERMLDTDGLSMKQKLDLNDKKNKLEKELKTAKQLANKANKKKLPKDEPLVFELSKDNIGALSVLNILKEVFDKNDKVLRPDKNTSKGPKEGDGTIALRREFDQRYHTFESYLRGVFNRISLTDVHYLEGTSIKLSAVLKSGDNQDGLLHSIKYLKEEGVFDSANNMTLAFIKKWLGSKQGFEIAEDLRVFDFQNEVFTIELLGDDDHWQHLGDYGLGAQRLVELIMGIARIIHHYQKNPKAFKPMILVEEPEAHIHPKLQSRLADFFYEVNKEHNLRFIVETHSEYIIRRTQLIGIQNELFTKSIGQNPFKVNYFDKKPEIGPYLMEYTEEGRFNRDFGEGFYDVSAKLVRATLKSSRQ